VKEEFDYSIDPRILTSALVEGELSASRPGRFTSGERAPGTHWVGRLDGPQNRSGRYGEEIVLHATGTQTPTIVARQRLRGNVTAVTNTHATTEELLDASF
jgi:hypothetical protein